MTIRSAPAPNSRSSRDAVFAIGHYFGLDADRGADRALLAQLRRSSACTRRSTSGADRRRRRRVPVRDDRARRAAFRLRRRHGRRRPSDAPPARDPALDDARPARRRPRARRADRALLWASEETIYGRFGYGHGLAAARSPDATRLAPAAAGLPPTRGPRPARRRRRGAAGVPAASATASARRTPGMSRATTRVVGAPHPVRRQFRRGGARTVEPGVLEHDGEPAGYAIYRD